MNDLAFLATVGPKCTAMELYKRAKNRLFGALYGKDGETALNAYAIMYKLKKKAFGIWSPFQMEDFLGYPVVERDFTREEWYERFKYLTDMSHTLVRPFGRRIKSDTDNPCGYDVHRSLGQLVPD